MAADLSSFEDSGHLTVLSLLHSLSGEPEAHSRVTRAAVTALREDSGAASARLAHLLELKTLPTTTPTTYLYLSNAPREELGVLLEALYERLGPQLFAVPLRVAMSAPGPSHDNHYTRRRDTDTPATLETALALLADGIPFSRAVTMARALED